MRRIIVGIGIIAISFLFISQSAMAENDNVNLTYDDVYTKIDIDTTGAITVNETMTVNLPKGQRKYIRKLDISNVSGVKNLTVSIIAENDKTVVLEPAETIEKLQDDQFYVETIYEDRIKMNVYIPVESYVDNTNQLKINLQYKATDLVSIYNDTAYFEWLVLMNGKETLQNFVIDITYPQKTNEEIKPMLSGAFYQREIRIDDWTTQIISTHVEANEQITFSVLMPERFCLDSRKIIEAKRAKQIIADQTQQKIEQEESELKYEISSKIDKMLNGGPVVLLIIATLFLFLIYGKQISFKESEQYKGKLPTYHSPAELAYQSGKRVRVIDFFATLIDLCNQHILDYKNMDDEIAFVLKDSEKAQQLKRHERYLINWIFNVHDTEQVTLIEIIEILDADRRSHKKAKFKKWVKTIHKQTTQLVKGEPIIVARIIGIIITLLTIILSTLLIIKSGDLAWASGMIGSSLLLLLYAYSLFNYKEQEKVSWLECSGLLKFFKEIKKHPNQSLTYNEWEKLLPYAVSLNQANQVTKQMKAMLDTYQTKEKESNVFKEIKDIELIINSMEKIK